VAWMHLNSGRKDWCMAWMDLTSGGKEGWHEGRRGGTKPWAALRPHRTGKK